MSDRSRFLLAGLALVVLAAVLRINGIGWGLPQVYEEATPLKKAWAMWGWGATASFDLNPHFFKYPTLTIYVQLAGQGILYVVLLALGTIKSVLDFRALYLVDQTTFLIMGRGLSTAFGLATVWMLYVLGRRIGGYAAGIAAAFLLAINTFHISAGQVVETDVVLTCLAVFSLWRALILLDAPTRRNAVWAGVAVGLTASAKYTGAFLFLPVVAALVPIGGSEKPSKKSKKTGRRRFRLAWLHLGLAAGASAVVFFITSPFVFLDFGAFWEDLAAERQHMQLGHFGGGGVSTLSYYFQSFSQRLMGWPLLLAGWAGLIYFTVVKRHPWAVCFTTFVVPYLLVVGTWSMRGDRYVLPAMVALVLFAAALVAEVVRLLERRGFPKGYRMATGIAATLLLAITPLLAYPAHLASRKSDTRTDAKLWIEANVPSGAFIALEWLGPEFLDPIHLWQLEPNLRRRAVQQSGRPVYAVQTIPMFQVTPERSAPYYDLSLYSMADLIITSSGIRDRYEKERERYAPQLAFYDSLETHYEKVLEFPKRANDPTIVVYLNRKTTVPFGSREDVDPPIRIPTMTPELLSGEETFFYYNLGLNYEAFGFHERALQAYEMAFEYPMIKRDMFFTLTVSATRSLLAMKRTDDALQFLQKASEVAPTAGEKERLRRVQSNIRRRVEAGGPP